MVHKSKFKKFWIKIPIEENIVARYIEVPDNQAKDYKIIFSSMFVIV